MRSKIMINYRFNMRLIPLFRWTILLLIWHPVTGDGEGIYKQSFTSKFKKDIINDKHILQKDTLNVKFANINDNYYTNEYIRYQLINDLVSLKKDHTNHKDIIRSTMLEKQRNKREISANGLNNEQLNHEGNQPENINSISETNSEKLKLMSTENSNIDNVSADYEIDSKFKESDLQNNSFLATPQSESNSSQLETSSTLKPTTSITSNILSTVSQSTDANSDNKYCRIGIHMKKYLPVSDFVYSHATCFWCYAFVAPHRIKSPLKLDYKRLLFAFENTTMVPLDPRNATTWEAVEAAMVDDLEAAKLEDCCMEADQCCDAIVTNDTMPRSGCPATWDGWSCLSANSPPDTSLLVRCPVHAYTGYPECYLYASKQCTGDGTWYTRRGNEYTDYTRCSLRQYHAINYYWEATVYGLSLVVLTPAIVIIVYYKALRLPRFRMHLNFFLALWFRAALKIIEVTVIKLPENNNTSTILEDNGALCRVLTTFNKLFLLAVWAWMLAESVFLYRLIARAFSRVTSIKYYLLAAWGVPVVVCGVWVTCRALLEDFQCWLGDHKGDALQLHLITDIPILVALLTNTGLLGHMSWIMFAQLRDRQTQDTNVNRRTLKATLFLVPMFGLQFLVTAVAPVGAHCTVLQVYMFLSVGLTGLQGLYVSILYCYNNREVQRQLTMTQGTMLHRVCPGYWERMQERRYQSGGVTSTSAGDPRTTYSTVPSDDHAGHSTEMRPLNSSRRNNANT